MTLICDFVMPRPVVRHDGWTSDWNGSGPRNDLWSVTWSTPQGDEFKLFETWLEAITFANARATK